MGTAEESRMKELIEDLQKQVTALKVLLDVERGFHKQQWVGLTDEQIKAMDARNTSNSSFYAGALWAEAKLREKNGYGS